MQQLCEDQSKLEELQIEREQKGWDLKFQNYWGYINAADKNLEQSLRMCQKLFDHIGRFREHATQQFVKIVDSLHDPNIMRNPAAVRVKDESLIPLLAESLTEDHKVFMDEDESSLYFSKEQKQSAYGPPQVQSHTIYVCDNIIYKITNPNELVF